LLAGTLTLLQLGGEPFSRRERLDRPAEVG
jgi:hypothetical protein